MPEHMENSGQKPQNPSKMWEEVDKVHKSSPKISFPFFPMKAAQICKLSICITSERLKGMGEEERPVLQVGAKVLEFDFVQLQ